ncbi:transposase [Streptomyces sp. enrichment culture]|uniref:transposase n=1 Tax=Streptomyces sp. enrichment culture TaxID=1795815 RepID=UPI003F556899
MRRRRHPSDTTAAGWALIEPLLPVPACRTEAGGRPEAHPRRGVVDAIRYAVDTGRTWRALPRDFPPWSTVCEFFARRTADGTVGVLRDQLRRTVRTGAGKTPQAVAVIFDSQSTKPPRPPSGGYRAVRRLRVGSWTWPRGSTAPGTLARGSPSHARITRASGGPATSDRWSAR